MNSSAIIACEEIAQTLLIAPSCEKSFHHSSKRSREGRVKLFFSHPERKRSQFLKSIPLRVLFD